MKLFKRLLRDRKGAAMVEYALTVAGVALIATAAIAVFGHKTNDMIAATAAVLPGAHADDNAPISSGRLIETTNVNGQIELDIDGIAANEGTSRLSTNLGSGNFEQLVIEPN